MDRNYKLAKRRYVIGGVVLTVVVLFIIRLFALQILSDDYRKNADSNAFLKKIQYPSRGVIYDRTGKLLVYNQPAYDITVVMKEITSLDTLDLCRTLRITPEFLRRKFRDLKDRRLNPGYSPYTNQVFLTQLSAEDCGVFQEKLFKFPGFYIQRRTIRQYNYNSGAHILGDIGEVSKQEMEDDEYYLPGDFIGKLGVERSYEKQLRGEKGVEVLLRDAHGRIQGNYMEGKFDKAPVPGKNLTLSLDIELQMLGERLLEGKIGSIVAIEPSTGEVLCLVSSPTYDPSLMIGRDRGKNHLAMSKDPWKPLLNRAIMGAYPPGSTFKVVTALDYFRTRGSFNGFSFDCQGSITKENHTIQCYNGEVHGTEDFYTAFANSCNCAFAEIGTELGGVSLLKTSEDLLFNKKLPLTSYRKSSFTLNGSSGIPLIMQTAIGQGNTLVSPMHMALITSAIANDGLLMKPYLIDKVTNAGGDTIRTTEPTDYKRLMTSNEAALLGKLMEGVVQNGTASALN